MTVKVLLLEDLRDAGADIKLAIEESGDFQVFWGMGANHADKMTIELITETDSEEYLLSDFNIAFIDFELEGNFTGGELVEILRAAMIVTVGISAKSDLNGAMMRAGANMTWPKHSLADSLQRNELEINEIIDTFSNSVGIGDDLSFLSQKKRK